MRPWAGINSMEVDACGVKAEVRLRHWDIRPIE
jgi:hypothetical protein